MFCKFCGAEIDDDCVVCPACGKQVAPLKTEKDYSGSSNENPFGKTIKGRNKLVAALLAIFLGEFGIHHFYLGNNRAGILSVIFFWTCIPALIGLIQGIMMIVESDDEFAKRIEAEAR